MSDKSMKNELTGSNLKAALWDTLQQVKAGSITPAQAGKVSGLAREVVNVLKTELQILAKSKMSIPEDVRSFVGGSDGEEVATKPRRKAS